MANNPRFRDLPEKELELLKKYPRRQTMPVDNPAEPEEKWAWYYQIDYDRWYLGHGIWD